MAFTPQGMSPFQLLPREPYLRRSGKRSGRAPTKIWEAAPHTPISERRRRATGPVRSTYVDRQAHDAVTSMPLNGARKAGLD